MEGRRRRRFPSKEELELWAKVTRHDEPMARTQPAAREMVEPPPAAMPRPRRKSAPGRWALQHSPKPSLLFQ